MNRLRPFTFFSPVVATLTAGTGRLDRLTIDSPRLGLGRMAGFHPKVFAESVVNALPDSRLPPVVEVVEDRLVIGEVVGKQFPRSASPQLIEDGVENLPAVDSRSSTLCGSGL